MNKISTNLRMLLFALIAFSSMAAVAQTPVQKYGRLQVKNGQVSDVNGNPIVLRGMSMFWSGFPEGTEYYNPQTVKELRDEFCVDIVRAALAVEIGNTNYVNNPSFEQAKVERVIDACIANGLYVLVDFHTEEAIQFESQARTFFTSIYNKYGNIPNIIYETYNEPVFKNWSTQLKPYHNRMISLIRGLGAQNIIVCGTRNFSQEVDEAANDPVTGTNVAYTLHYYANTHRESLRQKARNALNKGAAIFVTEYGTCNASGNGGFNPQESQLWWDFLEANKISSCNWSVSNKNETASILKSNVSSLNNWNNNNYTESGTLVRAYLNSKCGVDVISGSVTLSFGGGRVQYGVGEAVNISAATTVSSNGRIAQVRFFDGATQIGVDASAPYALSVNNLAPGGHNISARSFTAAGALIGESPVYVISIVGASNVSTTGITDQFESKEQFLELTGGLNGASCGAANFAAAAGIFWFEDRTSPGFTSVSTRDGDGKLKYTLTKSQGNFDVMGFVFGDYCDGTVKRKYTLDLSQNAELKMTVEAPATNTQALDLKMQLKDINGTVLAIKNTVLGTNGQVMGATWFQHEVGFSKNHSAPDFLSLEPGDKINFVYDFKNALIVNNPNNPSFPADIRNNNRAFDFTKVSEVILIPVNKADVGMPTFAPRAFTNQKLNFSGLSLGNAALGTDICTTPPAVGVSPVTYCQGETEVTSLFENTTSIDAFPLKWYTSATGGVGNEIAPIPSTSLDGQQAYYVSQFVATNPACEGPRTEIDVNIVAAPAVDAGEDQLSAEGPEVALSGSGPSVGVWAVESKPDGSTVGFRGTGQNVTATGLIDRGDYIFSYTVSGDAPCTSTTDVVSVTISSVLTIEDDLANLGVTMFPNPVGDHLTVDVASLVESKSIQILDATGRVVMTSTQQGLVQFNTSSLASGTYIVQITTGTDVYVRTIVK